MLMLEREVMIRSIFMSSAWALGSKADGEPSLDSTTVQSRLTIDNQINNNPALPGDTFGSGMNRLRTDSELKSMRRRLCMHRGE